MRLDLADGELRVTRPSDAPRHRALHGLTRSLIANAIEGVTKGYEKVLDLHGVGYRVQQSGPGITLIVGLSHQVNLKPLQGVTMTVEGQNKVHVTGVDKQKVGEMAAMSGEAASRASLGLGAEDEKLVEAAHRAGSAEDLKRLLLDLPGGNVPAVREGGAAPAPAPR